MASYKKRSSSSSRTALRLKGSDKGTLAGEGVVRTSQASRAWYAKLDSSLVTLVFHCNSSKHVVYFRDNGQHRLIVGVYTDDLIITGGDLKEMEQFKEEMKATF
jgi:hypothetical protein